MTEKVTKLALASRCIVFGLQLVSNVLVPDHKPDVFRSPVSGDGSTTWLDAIISVCFGGLRHWDGEYFLHIAEYLYTYENTLAFYPLFPLMIRHFGSVFNYLQLPLSTRSLLLCVAVCLNMVFFSKAANLLYQLTQRVFNDLNKSWNATLLFCFNPAAIFFSAAYSETVFSFLCFYLMLHCVSNRTFRHLTLALGAGFVCRSNGLINIGFPIYFYARDWLLSRTKSGMKLILKFIAMLGVAMVPLSLFYFYVYQQYCLLGYRIKHSVELVHYGRERNYVLSGDNSRQRGESPWCNDTLPFPYSYIQAHYWNVGFMRYYEWRQLPNFLLAMPILLFLHYHCYAYLKYFIQQLLPQHSLQELIKEYKSLPFVLHAYFLTLFCTFFVHIQVSTRLLASASPCLYWFAADHMPKSFAQLKLRSKAGWILLWFGSYFVIGTILFSNNLPWT